MLAPSPFKLPSDSLPPAPPPVAFCESLMSHVFEAGQGSRLRLTGPLRMMSWVRSGEGRVAKRSSESQGGCKWDQGISPQTQEASRVGRGRRKMGEDPVLQQAARLRLLPPPLSLVAVLRQGLSAWSAHVTSISVLTWLWEEGWGHSRANKLCLDSPSLCARHLSSPSLLRPHLLPLCPFTHAPICSLFRA